MSDSLQAAKAPDRAVNFQVTGMHCAACAARVERAVGALPGVESATVNLLQNNLKVEFASGAAEPERVVAAVHSLGFEAEAEDIAPSAGAALPEAALGEAPLASERPRSADSFAVFLERQSRQEAATAKRLQALTPPGHAARLILTITDEYPQAFALVVIEALPEPAA